jgi:pyridoxal phosphate enzyme (YggS family)
MQAQISQNIERIQNQLPATCKLVVVSKYRQITEIQAAYAAGQRLFAENRVQALLERREHLPSDIDWHLIGHLQTNKVKYIAPFIGMIHAVDSYKLLEEINKEAGKHNRIIPCLIQLHVATEETKFGFSTEDIEAFFDLLTQSPLPNTKIVGLMAMASNTTDKEQIANEFALVNRVFQQIKRRYFAQDPTFCELSIGMSSDYDIAIQNGSTLVRVGSAVFA